MGVQSIFDKQRNGEAHCIGQSRCCGRRCLKDVKLEHLSHHLTVHVRAGCASTGQNVAFCRLAIVQLQKGRGGTRGSVKFCAEHDMAT